MKTTNKIIEIAKILAERRGVPVGEISNPAAIRLLTNSKETVLKDLQKELLDYTLVVVGRKFCSACEDIKKNLQPGDLYVDADLVVEILPEKIPGKEAIFPIVPRYHRFHNRIKNWV